MMLTYHNDNLRTGQNPQETVLTTENVNSSKFGKAFSYGVDGAIYAQPLYVQNLQMPVLGVRNVVYVVTEHDSVYAFDADQKDPGTLWHVDFIEPASNATPVPCADESQACDFLGTEIGITSTPAIDLDTQTLYVCAFTKEGGSYATGCTPSTSRRDQKSSDGRFLFRGRFPAMAMGVTE
jgi:glucose dehydrogenase